MTPHDLIAAFDVLADAPDGVKRLRELVRQLAVDGRLLPENYAANSHPMRFGDVFDLIFTGPFGTSLKASDYVSGGVPVINPQNLRGGRIESTAETAVGTDTVARLKSFVVRAGDIVVARRGEMGRCAVVTAESDGWLCGTGSLVLRPPADVDPYFVALFLRAPATVRTLVGESVGSTMHNLNQRILVNLSFTRPPLAEQHRIVARVDELMGLLDRLEAARATRDAVRRAARDAALADLRDAPDAEAVEAAWARIARQMDDLFAEPADVAPLRQAVLALAVRGRLVAQEPGDEPASVLLDQITMQKSRLVRDHAIRKPGAVPRIAPREVPFELPKGWAASRLEALTVVVTDGDHQPPPRAEVGVAFLTIGNVSGGYLDFTDTRFVPPSYYDALHALRRPTSGDLLYTVVGATYGRPVPVDECPPFCVQRHIAIIRPLGVFRDYLARFLASPWAYAQATAAKTGSAQPTVALKPLRQFVVSVPPLAEQHRIVAKVDALMALCDDLEARLTAARDLQAQFAGAAVHHLEV